MMEGTKHHRRVDIGGGKARKDWKPPKDPPLDDARIFPPCEELNFSLEHCHWVCSTEMGMTGDWHI